MIQLDWNLVKETMADALDLAPERRAEFLRSRCADNRDLHAAVERLLSGHDSASGFLDAEPVREEPLTTVPERIGPYVLRERLGEGGFGVVYRATQVHPFERDVAIKLLKVGPQASAVAERFRIERDALARMDHEDICRVLDAGLSDDGSPFVVMDLVRGSPIGEHCARHGLDLRARVALVARAARAVHHAHQRAVIHCDVKPSNILVSLDDGATRVRLIDFGIARAIDEAEGTGRTRSDLAGTPRYMSPERRSASGAADVRSDVYSLGSVLSELLQASIEAKSAGSPALVRDVRAIATMATAAQPADRYESAAALAEDLERSLRGESIKALPERAWGSLRRIVRRHLLASALGAAAVLSLLVGTAVAMKSRSDALLARDEATREARRAEFVKAFLLDDMLGSLDPNFAQGREVTVVELLARVDERMRPALADDPLLLADVAATLGTAYRHLGRDAEAIVALEFAIATREAIQPPGHEDVLGWRVQLAAAMLGTASRHADGMALRAKNAAEAVELLGPWHPISMAARHIYTPLPLDVPARTRELEEIAERARALGPEGASLVEDVSRTLAIIYGETGRRDEAIQLLESATASAEARLGPNHSDTIVLARAVAEAHFRAGNFERANAILDDVVARTRALVPAGHPSLSGLLSNAASRKLRMGRIEEAIAISEEVEKTARERDGANSIQHVNSLLMLGQAIAAAGRFSESLAMIEPLVPTMEAQWGPRHAQTARAIIAVARAKAGLGDREGALNLAADVTTRIPLTHEVGLSALEFRCQLLGELGRGAEAQGLADEALKSLAPDAPPELVTRLKELRGDSQAPSATR